MSVFSDVFGEGIGYLSDASGETVDYFGPDKSEEKDKPAIVGNESLVEFEVADVGKVQKLKREFTFLLSVLDPVIHGVIQYGDEKWHIVGEASRSATIVRVVAHRNPVHERTRGQFRGGN